MTALEKKFVSFSVAVAVLFGVPQTVSAMHIMEGYLPPAYCVAWGAVCLPFLAVGIITMRRLVRQQRKNHAAAGDGWGVCVCDFIAENPLGHWQLQSHDRHRAGAILFGVPVTTILGVIVLLFQALLLAHGGLTTLGANTCSMAIAGPLLTWGLYQIGKKLRVPRLPLIFLASMLGDLFTYCVTSLQLALAYPSAQGGVGASMTEFLLVFAPTQLPLAVIEGLLTMLVIMGLETYAKTELHELREGRRGLFHDAE